MEEDVRLRHTGVSLAVEDNAIGNFAPSAPLGALGNLAPSAPLAAFGAGNIYRSGSGGIPGNSNLARRGASAAGYPPQHFFGPTHLQRRTR